MLDEEVPNQHVAEKNGETRYISVSTEHLGIIVLENTRLRMQVTELQSRMTEMLEELRALKPPVAMILECPVCDAQHVDEGEWATRPHRTHLCLLCGHKFRPANVPTVGVERLP